MRSRRPGSQANRKRALARLAGVLVVLSLSAEAVRAGNGDVLVVSRLLEGKDISDVAFDSSPNPPGGSFWILGRLTGKIYHLAADLQTSLGEIANPHGTGSIPNFILSWGLAYRPQTRTLLILAQASGAWVVREVDPSTGDEVVGGMFEISPPNPGSAALRGLSFDTVTGELWTLDSASDTVVRVSFEGVPTAEFPLPSPAPGQTILRGEGISFEIEQLGPGQFESRLYVPYGDLFTQHPTRIIQLTVTGEATGVEVPLALDCARGIQTQRIGLQRRIVAVACDGKVAQIEQVIPSPVPPSELRGSLSLSNRVELSWRNNGSGDGGVEEGRAYGGQILVLRNGVPFATLPGDATSFTDGTPLEGISRYALQAADAPGGPMSPASFPCEISVGVGGLVGWVPFDGNAVHDVARDDATGDVFVTDSIGTGGKGRVFVYDASLSPIGEIETPWERPGAVAWVPRIDIQNLDGSTITLEDVIAVGRTDGLLLTLMTRDGVIKTTFPMGIGTVGARVGSLTYVIPTQEFAALETTEHKIHFLDSSGRVTRTCVPSDLFGLPHLESGLTYDRLRDTFLATFADGFVREFHVGGSCVPTGEVEFPLVSLGEGYSTTGFSGGIQIADNTLLVCGKASNTIFRTLLFPYSPTFIRGDVSRDQKIGIDDAISIAQYLFVRGPAPSCADAADVNDDSVIDISDPVYLLFFLYVSGPAPPPPYPLPGTDPTFRDNLGCGD